MQVRSRGSAAETPSPYGEEIPLEGPQPTRTAPQRTVSPIDRDALAIEMNRIRFGMFEFAQCEQPTGSECVFRACPDHPCRYRMDGLPVCECNEYCINCYRRWRTRVYGSFGRDVDESERKKTNKEPPQELATWRFALAITSMILINVAVIFIFGRWYRPAMSDTGDEAVILCLCSLFGLAISLTFCCVFMKTLKKHFLQKDKVALSQSEEERLPNEAINEISEIQRYKSKVRYNWGKVVYLVPIGLGLLFVIKAGKWIHANDTREKNGS